MQAFDSAYLNFLQPMSLVCLGDYMVFPPHAIKYLKEDDPRKTIQKPTLRKLVEVRDVTPLCVL